MKTAKVPSLFVGHGSPLNVLSCPSWIKFLKGLHQKINKHPPRAVIVISAHWQTSGLQILSVEKPKTIHDFYGFPQELFDIQYPAPGSIEISQEIYQRLSQASAKMNDSSKSLAVETSQSWGLDHGAWSILYHLFPQAHTPIIPISLPRSLSWAKHWKLGEALRDFRSENIMILGSGNIVHNLQNISWEENASPWPWATEYDQIVKKIIQNRDWLALQTITEKYARLSQLSIQGPEHFLPLLWTAACCEDSDQLEILFPHIQNASISMTSFLWNS